MRVAIAALVVLVLATCATSAKQQVPAPSEYEPRDLREPHRRINWFWFDDLEPADSGWTHGDYLTAICPHFHVDAYLAYGGEYSWWCGTFNYDADGGYGNAWDDRLLCPEVDVTGSVYPVITFAYRNDTEPDHDFTYVVQSLDLSRASVLIGSSPPSCGLRAEGRPRDHGSRLLCTNL